MKKVIILVATLILSLGLNAKIKLPEILGDNAVLQQNTKVQLWGEADNNTKVTVNVSWSADQYSTISDENGRWTIKIPTSAASFNPQSITISDGTPVTLSNILIGEVWFCSGQSNMEQPLKGWPKCPIKNSTKEIVHSGEYKNSIRSVNISREASMTREEYVPGKWKECVPENAKDFSAVAYFYAQNMTKVLNVPIGIINCSWGGTRVEGWMPRKLLKNYPDIDLTEEGMKAWKKDWMRPLVMFNGMVNPIEKYTIKGFLFYQGESNHDYNVDYPERLAAMVKLWREEWGLGELPFYYVQIAPFAYGHNEKNEGAILREDQEKALKLIPNSGMVCTTDIVKPSEIHNIHFSNKQDVGFRLAIMSLSRTYGIKGFNAQGPVYKDYKIDGNKIIVSFSHAYGFNLRSGIKGFEIAGADRKFYPAEVKLMSNNSVMVSSPNVKEPKSVRYCFKNFQIGNFKGYDNLPVYPFRTDDWDR